MNARARRRDRSRHCLVVPILLALAAIGSTSAEAQPQFVTPGPNTNIIGLTPSLAEVPDFALKQQQEPSCIVRSSNTSYLLCAYNDMRASDRPAVQGDGWIGVSMSADAGQTWFSRLSPGYRGHANSLGMGFAADPGLVEIPGDSPGLAVLSFIGGFRDSSDGVFVAQRWVEYAQEDRHFWRPESQIHTIALGAGGQGRFLDKPAILYVVDPVAEQSTLTESIRVEGVSEPVTITTPTGTLIVAYAIFTGGLGSQVWTKRSFDNGRTWVDATKLTEEQNEVSGVALTAIGRNVVAAWRRRADVNDGDAVMTAFSSDGGRRWTRGQVLFDLCPFDQPATGASFRTFAFPWLANDGARYWVFAADRRFAGDASCAQLGPTAPAGTYSGVSRIVGMSSADGLTWVGAEGNAATPFVVNAAPAGYQIMPTAFGTKGRIDVAWYDTRREEPLPPGNAVPLINDYLATSGLARVFRKADVYMTRLTASCGRAPTSGCMPSIEPAVRVSRYPFVLDAVINDGPLEQSGQEVEAHQPNLRLYASGTLAFKGDYIAVATRAHRRIASGQFIPNALPEGAAGIELPGFVETEDVLVAWGDNRDVRADFVLDPNSPQQLPYTPTTNSAPGIQARRAPTALEAGALLAANDGGDDPSLKSVTEPDDDPGLPSDMYECSANFDYSRSRDANIYASLVVDEASLTSPTPTKPLGTIQRTFPLQLDNPDRTSARAFCLAIENQPPDYALAIGRASFYQLPAAPPFNGAPPPLVALDVVVPGLSSVSRSVFVVTSDASTVIGVSAYDGTCAAPGALVGSLSLADGPLFDPEFCAVPIPPDRQDACLAVASDETHNVSLVSPGIQAPPLQAPVVRTPGIQAPGIQAPGVQAPGIQAQGFLAPGIQAPGIQAPGIQANTLLAPGIQAPGIQAPSLADAVANDPASIVYQDVTYVVSTDGNVTTTYSADVAVSGLDPDESQVQLIAWTPNVYGTAADCLTVPTADFQVIASVDLDTPGIQAVGLPTAFTPENQNPYTGEISFTGTPDKDIALTVRIWATGASATVLEDLHEEYLDCFAAGDASICDPSTAGAAALITFGASAHACNTNALPNPGDPNPPDCLDNGNEKIFVDRVGPEIYPPDGTVVSFEANSPEGVTIATPDGVPFFVQASDSSEPLLLGCESADIELQDTQTTVPVSTVDDTGGGAMLVPTRIVCSASDAFGNTSVASIGMDVLDNEPPVLDVAQPSLTVEAVTTSGAQAGAIVDFAAAGQRFTATDRVAFPVPTAVEPACVPADGGFFALGATTVACTIDDTGPNVDAGMNTSAPASFDVVVVDTTGPVLEVENLSFSTVEPSVVVDYLATVSAMDLGGAVTVSCSVNGDAANPYEFPPGVTTVNCTAADDAGNTTTADFTVTVNFGFAIRIAAIKGRVNAGSTVPIDWQYLDRITGRVVDSSRVNPRIVWRGPFARRSGCSGPNTGTGNGEDAGSSDFRYSASNRTWQYSLQTEPIPGDYLVTISPPGSGDPAASICVPQS